VFDNFRASSFITAGVFLIYENKFAFMIGPDKSGDKLGIVRLGGHIEENEGIIDCIKREVREEASVAINIVSSSITYYMNSWAEETLEVITGSLLDLKPLLIVGDNKRATALYLAYTEERLVPAAEAHGIILLSEKQILEICSDKMTLTDFVNHGGQLLRSQEMNFEFELSAGPHLRFLSRLINCDSGLIKRFTNRTL
jgi:hypothetical protein